MPFRHADMVGNDPTDADAMTDLDNVVALLCERAYLGKPIAACNSFVKQKITKSYAQMSPETQALTRDKYESIMKVLF